MLQGELLLLWPAAIFYLFSWWPLCAANPGLSADLHIGLCCDSCSGLVSALSAASQIDVLAFAETLDQHGEWVHDSKRGCQEARSRTREMAKCAMQACNLRAMDSVLELISLLVAKCCSQLEYTESPHLPILSSDIVAHAGCHVSACSLDSPIYWGLLSGSCMSSQDSSWLSRIMKLSNAINAGDLSRGSQLPCLCCQVLLPIRQHTTQFISTATGRETDEMV